MRAQRWGQTKGSRSGGCDQVFGAGVVFAELGLGRDSLPSAPFHATNMTFVVTDGSGSGCSPESELCEADAGSLDFLVGAVGLRARFSDPLVRPACAPKPSMSLRALRENWAMLRLRSRCWLLEATAKAEAAVDSEHGRRQPAAQPAVGEAMFSQFSLLRAGLLERNAVAEDCASPPGRRGMRGGTPKAELAQDGS